MRKRRKHQPHTCSSQETKISFQYLWKKKVLEVGCGLNCQPFPAAYFFLYLEPNRVSWLLLTPRNTGNIWFSSLDSWKREGKLHYKGLLVRQMNNVCLPYFSAQEFLINLSLHSFPFIYLATLLSLQHILFYAVNQVYLGEIQRSIMNLTPRKRKMTQVTLPGLDFVWVSVKNRGIFPNLIWVRNVIRPTT